MRSLLRGKPHRPSCWSMKCSRSATRASRTSAWTSSRSSSAVNKTILLVTHSLSLIERFCDEALWLDAGRAMAHGDPKRVVGAYLTKVEEGEEKLLAQTTARAVEAASRSGGQDGRDGAAAQDGTATPDGPLEHPVDPTSNMFQATEGRWGSREVEITEVTLLAGDGQASFVFHSGEPIAVRVKLRAAQPVDDFVFGIGLFNADGVCCYGTNTYLEELTRSASPAAAR